VLAKARKTRRIAMPKRDIDKKRVRITAAPPKDSAIVKVDEVFIVVTQAFCQNGHNLVQDGGESFDGYPGIQLLLDDGKGHTGSFFLSPFHGDGSKKGKTDWAVGTKLQIRCPTCKTSLPVLAKCHCDPQISPNGGDLVKLFLSPALTDSHILALCNVWGCRKSRTIDNWNIISEYLDGQISD
jgi:hypothetical protein